MADESSQENRESAKQDPEILTETAQTAQSSSTHEGSPELGSSDVPLDTDDDLAVAIAAEESEQPLDPAQVVNVDEALRQVAPEFQDELERISSENFDRVVIHKGSAAEAPPPEEKTPPIWRTYIANLSRETKQRFLIGFAILLTASVISLLILTGYLLPRFTFPYKLSMAELTTQIYSYPTDGVEVPLFDDFRAKSFTFALPKATMNLKTESGQTAYGEFEFFLNLRDRDLVSLVESKQSDLLEIVRSALETVTWDELETPLGKEKVKKLLRFKINEYLQGNMVLSVYYRSVVLSR